MKRQVARLFNGLHWLLSQLIKIWPVLLITAVIANSAFLYQQRNNLFLISHSVADDSDVQEISDKVEEIGDTLEEMATEQEEMKSALGDAQERIDHLDRLELEDTLNELKDQISGLEFDLEMAKLDASYAKQQLSFIDECTYSQCSLHEPLRY